MLEDKLTRDERIRLEALDQATYALTPLGVTGITVINRAQEYEKYIRGEDKDASQDT